MNELHIMLNICFDLQATSISVIKLKRHYVYDNVFTGDYLCQINPVKNYILPDKFDVFYSVNAVRIH